MEHFIHQRGHRVLRIVRKGGEASTEPLASTVLHAIEEYVGERDSGPIFLNAEGADRLSYSASYVLIRRLAERAGIASAAKISPHSLRHSFRALALADGMFRVEVRRGTPDLVRLTVGLLARCVTITQTCAHVAELGRRGELMVCVRTLYEHTVMLAWLSRRRWRATRASLAALLRRADVENGAGGLRLRRHGPPGRPRAMRAV